MRKQTGYQGYCHRRFLEILGDNINLDFKLKKFSINPRNVKIVKKKKKKKMPDLVIHCLRTQRCKFVFWLHHSIEGIVSLLSSRYILNRIEHVFHIFSKKMRHDK